MKEKIDVNKVAELARLEIKDEEVAFFQDKFGAILEYFESLSEVDTEQNAQPKDESNQEVYREDVPAKSDVSPEEFSPHIVDQFFKVPKVIE